MPAQRSQATACHGRTLAVGNQKHHHVCGGRLGPDRLGTAPAVRLGDLHTAGLPQRDRAGMLPVDLADHPPTLTDLPLITSKAVHAQCPVNPRTVDWEAGGAYCIVLHQIR